MDFNVLKMLLQSIFLDCGEQSLYMIGPFIFQGSYYFIN